MRGFAESTTARLLFEALLILTLCGAHALYRPLAQKDGWVRCQYAPVVRQLALVFGAGMFALVSWGVLKHGAPSRGAWGVFALLFGVAAFAVECWTRHVDFSASGLVARSAWRRAVRVSWSEVVRIDRKWYVDMYRFHFADGRRLIVPDQIVGVRALLCEAVRQLPVDVYFGARKRLDREIPRLECEIDGAIARVKHSNIDGVSAPDAALATLGLCLPVLVRQGFDVYYRDARGALADWLALALARIGASSHAELVEQANRWVSGAAGLLRDQDERAAELDRAAGAGFQALRRLDEAFLAEPGELGQLLREYVDSFGELSSGESHGPAPGSRWAAAEPRSSR
ncbi:MAG TPA: DUF4375 domain-containing protein [Polyangiaceae bacterium]|nr:DUF4375 domain-containing protein [Polyangiaceae bacterium]